ITDLRLAQEALAASEEEFRSLVTNIPGVVYRCALDKDWTVSFVSPLIETLTGYTPDAFIQGGRGLVSLIHPEGRDRVLGEIHQQLRERGSFVAEYRILDKAGTVHWVLASGRAHGGTGGRRPDHLSGALFDVTPIKAAEERLRQTAIVFDNTTEGIMITDAQGAIVAVNRAFSEITGYTAEEVQGKHPNMLSSGRHDEAFYQAMWQALEQTGHWRGEIWNRHKNGEVIPLLQTISAVRDESGRVTGYVAMFSDISHIKQTEARLERLAYHDALTGLPNRLLFDERLEHAIQQATRHGERLAVLYFDLDHFKQLNDSLGHQVGDTLLEAIAARLKRRLHKSDTLSRRGGDEFTLLLENLRQPEQAANVARDILRHEDAWFALKRCLLRGSVTIEEPNVQTQLITTPTLEPQPIPLDVKVILLGNSTDYWAASRDEDFGALFKVKAEFSTRMPRTPENELAYAYFLRNRMQDEDLMAFDRTGVAAMVEHGSRYIEDQRKLTTRFSEIADVAREAAFWAKRAGRAAVSAEDVRTALRERRQRLNRYEEDQREYLLQGFYFVQTTGVAVGQINALSVFDLVEYEFAQPSRITARSYLTRSGISDIDRNVNFTDATHNKGLAIVDSYLSGLYSIERSLTLSASVTFEQSYGSHEGDSASCALLIAMLSAVTGLPVPQHYAVTGTLDQFGFVRPIGGTNAKVEGFFDVCQARGLDGTHGVIIPAANAEDLMLREDVVEAVRAGLFKVIAIEHVDDLIELMFGMPAGVRGADGRFPEGTLHARVEAILREMDEKLDDQRKGDRSGRSREPEAPKSSEPEPETPPSPPEPPADPVSPSS
uniref:PAS domain S-box protein n=1 Tax=Candidatus Roseilinea sp. NK_OTU-006 TaxID=2704250 RepID=UPI00145F97E8